MADEEEEPVDPKIAIDAKCAASTACTKLLVEYEACAKRIEAKGQGECSGWYMDYLGCIDACVRPRPPRPAAPRPGCTRAPPLARRRSRAGAHAAPHALPRARRRAGSCCRR